MPSTAEIREETERELERRKRLAVPAFAGGFLYLLSAIVITSTLNGLPTVGPLQGLTPTTQGVSEPSISPRAPEVKYISHHAFDFVVGSVLAAVAIIALMLVLLLLFDASAFRRPETWAPARILVLVGGIAVAVASIAHEVVYAVETHNFATGSDFSRQAVENALTKAAANQIVAYVSLLAGIALVVGMIVVMLNSLRTGLLPRWLAFLGMFSALLILLPNIGPTLQLIPAFWLVMMGMLLSGKWPGGDPPAWEAGEARPWPSRAQMQAERAGRAGTPATVAAGNGNGNGEAVPAPTQPSPAASARKRRRKRGSRG
jgi:hypothetical protein